MGISLYWIMIDSRKHFIIAKTLILQKINNKQKMILLIDYISVVRVFPSKINTTKEDVLTRKLIAPIPDKNQFNIYYR